MKKLTRDEAIASLREALVDVSDGEHSICFIAKEKGLFCRGFAQWKLHELKSQYPQITRSRPRLTRGGMEDLADRWQVARQFVKDQELACDVQTEEGKFQTCKGWDEYTDEELEGFHSDLCGENVTIAVPGDEPGPGG